MMFSGCGGVAGPVPQEVQESNVAETEANSSNTFGSIVEFDGLKITFGTELNHHRLEAGGFDWRLEAA